MNEYIEQKIQQPIERMLNDPKCKAYTWYGIRREIETAREVYGLFDEVHEALLPLYKQYMMANQAFFKDREHGRKARDFMSKLLGDEPEYFFADFDDIDLVECAMNWSKYPHMEKHLDLYFSTMLSTLLRGGYRPDIKTIKEKLYSRLGNRKEYGDYKELEMYCMLMAHLLVYERDLPMVAKENYYKKIYDSWFFLKYMYSFMLAHIIGMKHRDFSNVISTLVNSKHCYPYMHIAYKAIEQNLKRLYANGKIDYFAQRPVNDVIDEKFAEMEKIVKQNARNEDLIPLCKILFPKKIEKLLNQYCPPTYKELQHDIDSLNKQYDDILKKMVTQFNSSVSIDEIEDAFSQFRADLALSSFGTMNTLFAQNDTWRKYAPQIQRHILERQEKEKQESMQALALALSQIAKGQTIINQFGKDSCHFGTGSSMNGNVNLKD